MVAASRLNEQERLDWLQLFRSQNIGVHTFYQLLSIYGTAENALKALPELLKRTGNKKSIVLCPRHEAEKELERVQKLGATIIAACEPDYSPMLRQIDDAPPVITVLGRKELLQTQAIAMVGARNASANGCRLAYKLAQDLGKENLTVVSGLARGIDTAAHKGALATNTIAVIAGGIDHIYPKENTDLFHLIAEHGAIIAELPIGTIPQGRNFPQRNRIISGLSLGTLVVEATLGSGSLITARMALEQNREVFAIPGSPLDPRCNGTNQLIKQGAALTETSEDITNVFQSSYSGVVTSLCEQETSGYVTALAKTPTELELDKAYPLVLEKLGMSAVTVDELIVQTALKVNIILTILLELELAGRLERYAGNKVSLIFEGKEEYEPRKRIG